MTGFTAADVARLAEMMGGRANLPRELARRLLEQGVTLPPPPPDPAVVVARALWVREFPPIEGDDPGDFPGYVNLVAAVRDIFPDGALEAAAHHLTATDA